MMTRTEPVRSPSPSAMRDITHVSYPFGLYAPDRSAGYALCPDGIVRRFTLRSSTPDTFYSIPARVRAYRVRDGKRERVSVAGYVTTAGIDARPELGEREDTVRFRPYNYRRNGDVIVPTLCAHRYPTGNACASITWSPDPARYCPMHDDTTEPAR